MKPCRILWVAIISAILTSAVFAADTKPQPAGDPKTNPAFEKIKSLAGDWEGKLPDGRTFLINFRVTSAGSAVLQSGAPPGEPEMITVFHADGPRLMATHYCAAKNQIRYVAETSPDLSVITFKFKDATNMASPDEGHMHEGTTRFLDADHLAQTWVWRQNGKDQVLTGTFTRKK